MANGALTTLILGSPFGGNNIGGQGAIAIAEALKVHSHSWLVSDAIKLS